MAVAAALDCLGDVDRNRGRPLLHPALLPIKKAGGGHGGWATDLRPDILTWILAIP
jgi:hypothetical protein